MPHPIFIILLSLLFSAFFSGMEIAFISANKLKIELENKQKKFAAGILSHFIKSPSNFIGAMLIGNSISLVIYGIMMAGLLEPKVRSFLPHELQTELVVVIIQTFLSTLLILITAEFLPKVLFRLNPNQTLNFFAIPVSIIYYLLFPIVFVIIWMAEFILQKGFKMEFVQDKPVFGRIDLDDYVKNIATQSRGVNNMNEEMQIFQKALDFTDVKVRECMIPRTEIVALEVNEPINTLQQLFVKTGLSRILIYQNSIDHIIGFTHSYEMFKNPTSISSILLPISIVPETMPANELLTLFIQQHKSIALIVDEFGITSGIVTMEDVMEEIFGEIEDEFDVENKIEKRVSEHEFILSARLEIDYLNNKYHLNIPVTDEYETLAGFIFHHHENIPDVDEVIHISPFTFFILEVSETRIERVKLKIE